MDIEQESNNAHRIDDEKGEAQCECESKLPVIQKRNSLALVRKIC